MENSLLQSLYLHRYPDQLLSAEHVSVSGAENGAERAENRVTGSGAVSGHSRKHLSGQRARSADQSPLAPSISLINIAISSVNVSALCILLLQKSLALSSL